ncbi:hypothetical protein BJH93_05115 [Kocuria polaris]|nr:hypothetical protein [Kocuria polaris]
MGAVLITYLRLEAPEHEPEALRRFHANDGDDVVVNNATASLQDTSVDAEADWAGRPLRRVSAETYDRQFAVDARAGALMIAEFADPEEVGDLAAFLVSEAGRRVTGNVIRMG